MDLPTPLTVTAERYGVQAQENILAPLVKAWEAKLAKARERKKPFQDTADACMAFYSADNGFLFKDEFRSKLLGSSYTPRFQITLMKAYELVASYGPYLYDHNPTRVVRTRRRFELTPELLGDPHDPNLQQQFQQVAQLDNQDRIKKAARCKLAELHLEHSPREQPHGGLRAASLKAIQEYLIKGRGVLWPGVYLNPESPRKMSGSFYDSVENLLVDPDATSIAFGDCKWIARKVVEPFWQAERRFKLVPGTLKGKGTYETAEAQAERETGPLSNYKRRTGETFDLIEYYEIWSIGGAGGRLSGTTDILRDGFDSVVGDFAYIVVAPGHDTPLNLYGEAIKTATIDDVRNAFRWPFPTYKRQKWPCALLDAWSDPGAAWPISPLKPGLPELTAINLLLSFLLNRTWTCSRTIIGVLKEAASTVQAALNSNDDVKVVELNSDIVGDLNRAIQQFQFQDISGQIWSIIDKLSDLFDRRVGLTELWFGMNSGAASRSAEDARSKYRMATLRPDFMAKQIDAFMSDAALLELMAAKAGGISGQDQLPLLGPVGAQMWDALFAQADFDELIDELEVGVEPESSTKPNKEGDNEKLMNLYQPMSQQFMAYAQATGGNTEPLNALNRSVLENMRLPSDGFLMGPMAPPPPPPPDPNQPPPPDPLQQKMALQQQAAEQKMALKQQQHEQKLGFKQQDQELAMMLDLMKAGAMPPGAMNPGVMAV